MGNEALLGDGRKKEGKYMEKLEGKVNDKTAHIFILFSLFSLLNCRQAGGHNTRSFKNFSKGALLTQL